MPRALRTLALLSILVLASCSRAVQIGSDSGSPTSYRVQIRNETNQPMIVSYNDGRGDAILGTVQPNATESYIIASPARTDISIKGVSTSRTAGPYAITLTSGTQQLVRLR
jgi:hypothetical protein